METEDMTKLVRDKLGKRIRELREARGLRQIDLAEKACIDRSYISGIENGRRNVSIDNVARMAQALDISVAELCADIEFDSDMVDERVKETQTDA